MKVMTCKQMGGPCDTKISGETADDMMQNGATHLEEMAEQGDEAHKKAVDMMEEAQQNPESGEKWFMEFKAKFDALP